ncbi:holin family protein [Enterococcus faecalis]|uniref:phage holin family protein n=1 Tax=Enterococcus TaxID=1350 RepID=UPI0017808A7B|nr:phage holin family protein [Enterococcus faecalis]EIA7704195.1 phage holin family protein [Enterococcus faecalis]MBD9915256.1 phage holin family protein [Enterococcus faecalis]MBD9941872.1 phage holin family protein [Enterococcus faecalis]MDN3189146.1 phage holin family protein [Enterococcus faecalis]HBC4851973.1 phage holin family protein [Enterococcus faecalis]
MERYLNTITMLLSIFGGIVVRLLGGLDQLLDVFLFLIIVDFITGWIKAIATKELSSRIGMLGIAKKVTMLFVVSVAVRVEKVVGNNLPIREMVLIFYIANEGLSFFENIATFIPMPKKLKELFIQLKNKDD